MNPAHSPAALAKAREEFQKTEVQTRDAERRMTAAKQMCHLAKVKFKQSRKWAKQTKKLVKRSKAELAEKLRALQKAADSLKKLEKKALKQLKKMRAKVKPAAVLKKSKPAKPVKTKVTAKAKPVARKKRKVVKPIPRTLPAPALHTEPAVAPAPEASFPSADAGASPTPLLPPG